MITTLQVFNHARIHRVCVRTELHPKRGRIWCWLSEGGSWMPCPNGHPKAGVVDVPVVDQAAAERRRIATYTLCGDGDGWVHHDACAVSIENGGHDTCTCGLEELLEQLREVAPL